MLYFKDMIDVSNTLNKPCQRFIPTDLNTLNTKFWEKYFEDYSYISQKISDTTSKNVVKNTKFKKRNTKINNLEKKKFLMPQLYIK